MSAAESDPRRGGGHRLACWYCAERLRAEDVARDGILRARAEAAGGPFRLLPCPRCGRNNRCEKTPRGRWFSSPDFRPSLLDWLLGRLLHIDPGDFLQAVAWHEEQGARRRHFFERDGDERYSKPGLWQRLREGRGHRDSFPGEERRRRQRPDDRAGRPRPGDEESRSPPPRAGPRRIPAPHEILGVAPDVDEVAIHRAFHRLAVRYHPDKVHHLGEEFQAAATRRFQELQRAYEAILRARAAGRPPPGSPPPA